MMGEAKWVPLRPHAHGLYDILLAGINLVGVGDLAPPGHELRNERQCGVHVPCGGYIYEDHVALTRHGKHMWQSIYICF
jgi:hypothetical protein